MAFILIITASVLVLATLLPLSIARYWWIRALDFPRLQIAIIALIWLLLWLLWSQHDSLWLGACALGVTGVLIYQCYWIFPNTELHRLEVERYEASYDGARPEIKLLNSNVLMSNRNSDALIALVHRHRPDILITLESDQWWQDRLDQLEGYEYRIACPRDNMYGMHVYSRLPLLDPRIDFLVEDDKPSMSATVDLGEGVRVHLRVVHPAPPAPGENDESTERDVELLLLARSLANCPERIIVAGDLNDVAWSATTRLFRQLSGLLDLRTGRGLYNTFNANHWYARWPLDHFFVSSHFKVIDIQRMPPVGSDHFPLLINLAVVADSFADNSVEHEDMDEERLDSIMQSGAAHGAQMPTAPI